MKMPKEYVLILIVGLFLLAYLLEAVVDPLALPLSNPYQFVTSNYAPQYPFTTAIIAIRSLATLMTPLWLFSFVAEAYQFKAIASLIISVLIQLYAVQGLLSPTVGIPQEWAISFALGGAILLLPMLYFFAKGAVSQPKTKQPTEIGSLTDDDDYED